jgi:hypothetical protein
MNYTDEQLKQALAKMLPEKIRWNITGWQGINLVWQAIYEPQGCWKNDEPVLDTELLHICWLVADTLSLNELYECDKILESLIWATWQQRVKALAKVKGIKI